VTTAHWRRFPTTGALRQREGQTSGNARVFLKTGRNCTHGLLIGLQILIAMLIAAALMLGSGLSNAERTRRDCGRRLAAPSDSGDFLRGNFDGWLPRRALAQFLSRFGLRGLSFYILTDRVLGRPEEGRYVSLRKQWGASAERRLFFFYQYQALFAVLFALPTLAIDAS